jgi:murein DD-endopeptidase MepM/ murein hydrolase activator NlpD
MRTTLRTLLVAMAAAGAAMAWGGRAAVRVPLIAQVTSAQAASAQTAGPATAGMVLIPVLGVVKTSLHSMFNEGRAGHVHHAIDILAPRGTPVLAAVDGTVRKLFNSHAGGLSIYQFDRGEELVYYYAHLDAYAPAVVEGMAVRQGTVLGYVGTTGNAPANTPHLHFSIERLGREKQWWRSEPIDPYPILMERGVTATTTAPLMTPASTPLPHPSGGL